MRQQKRGNHSARGTVATDTIGGTLDQDFAAFDALPASIRRLISEAPFKLSAIGAYRSFVMLVNQGASINQIRVAFSAEMQRVTTQSARLVYGPTHPQS